MHHCRANLKQRDQLGYQKHLLTQGLTIELQVSWMIQKTKQSQQDLRLSLPGSWEKESLGLSSEFLAWVPKRGLEVADLRRKMFTSGHFGFEVPKGKLPGKWLEMLAQSSEELPDGRCRTRSQMCRKRKPRVQMRQPRMRAEH